MVEQAKHVLRVEAELAIGNRAVAERVEIANSNIAAEQDRVRSVQIDDLNDKSADIVRIGATEPAWSTSWVDGDVLRVVEHNVAARGGVGGAVECADVEEGGRPGGTMGREELVEEGCSPVEQDGLGSEEEVGICSFGLLVAVELVLSHNSLIV